MNKNTVKRQRKIKEIISKQNVSTQEELCALLKSEGIFVTQATLSRDVNELGLRKTQTKTGTKYILENMDDNKNTTKFISVYKNSIRDFQIAGNLVIVKTILGAAQSVCAFIDSLNLNDMAGAIAGDDTIFIAARSPEATTNIIEELRSFF